MPSTILDLHDHPASRAALLRANNEVARETSLLAPERFDQMIAWASVATFIAPDKAFLLAFAHTDEFDGGHFKWFASRYDRYLYIDRIVVAEGERGRGHGRMLYEDLFTRAEGLGQDRIVCEVNRQPPNPQSEAFHAALGFEEVGRATINDGAKTVRYLARRL
jgi:predicted GNAT superfamily acetyltransferase